MNTSTEIWKEIPGFSKYEASSLGRIRLVKYVSTDILSSRGYPIVRPMNDKEKPTPRTKTVHSLVMKAFHGERPGMVIDHINGDQTDNRLDNLRYCTQKENLNGARKDRMVRKGLYLVFEKRYNKWKLSQRVGDKIKFVKYFPTKEDGVAYANTNCG